MECCESKLFFLNGHSLLVPQRNKWQRFHSRRDFYTLSSFPGYRHSWCSRRRFSRRVVVVAKAWKSAFPKANRRSRAVEDHFEKVVALVSAQVAQQFCERQRNSFSLSRSGKKLEENILAYNRVSVDSTEHQNGNKVVEQVFKYNKPVASDLCNEEALVVFPLTLSPSNSTIYSFRSRESQGKEVVAPLLFRNSRKEEKRESSKHWAHVQLHLSYLSWDDLCKVELAFKLCAEWIDKAVDSNPNFLIAKVLEMTLLLASFRADKNCLIANFLSILEGRVQYSTLTRLCLLFGNSVLNILHEYVYIGNMAHVMLDIPERSSNWVKTHLWMSITDSRAVLLRLVERLWTLRHVHRWPLYLQQSTALETLQVFVPLASLAGLGSHMYELGDRSLRILFPYSYLKLEKWHLFVRDKAQDVLSSAQRELILCLMRDPFLSRVAEQFSITGRTKNVVSTFIKMLKQNKTREQIFDFIAMRVIIRLRPGAFVGSEEDTELAVCSRVYEIVTSIWKEVTGRHKDYVISPKPNGYRSIHTTIEHPSGFPIEVQIRTEAMHLLAEYGTASHRLYKGGIDWKNPCLKPMENVSGVSE